MKNFIYFFILIFFLASCTPYGSQEKIYTVINVLPLADGNISYILLSPSKHKIILNTSQKNSIKLGQKIKFE